MFALALGSLAKSFIGAANPFLSTAAFMSASYVGNFIDNRIFGSRGHKYHSGFRLNDLSVQTATYGKFVPIVFGRMKLMGNIIWSSDIVESSTQHTEKIGPKGARTKRTETYYHYKISIAIAICKGEVEKLSRIWINDKLIELNDYKIRFYNGAESQTPDPLLEKQFGHGKTTAFRGISYVVFEDLDLGEYNNRVPVFSFEIVKKAKSNTELEDKVSAISIGPGTGEFYYDTQKQYLQVGAMRNGKFVSETYKKPLNFSESQDQTYGAISCDKLSKRFDKIKWICIPISWFATHNNIQHCNILPGVENKNQYTYPEEWGVAKYSRGTAHLISQDTLAETFGGTPSDEGLIRYLTHLRQQGYKIMLRPKLVIDQQNKSAEFLHGNAKYIEEFFNKKTGFKNFILHYAQIAKQHADGILIGNNLQEITQTQNEQGQFLAVDQLVQLADQVKKIVGKNCLVSYAAHHQEYHHAKDGWHHLDPLWAASSIDFVGVDAYFPLTQSKQSLYNAEKIRAAWLSGEGYDFFYDNDGKCKELPKNLAYKNIKFWWENKHINPNNEVTPWQPKSKKIWFTEYGFRSIIACTNQQETLTSKSAFDTDFYAQHQAIVATEDVWKNSEFVQNKFLHTWDIKPFPNWPNNIHSNTKTKQLWEQGYYIQGKSNISSIKDVVSEICNLAGFDQSQLDLKIQGNLLGFVINHMQDAKSILEQLQDLFDLSCRENNGKLEFINADNYNYSSVNHDDIIPIKNDAGQSSGIEILREKTFDLPSKLILNYISDNQQYSILNCFTSQNEFTNIQQDCIEIPVILPTSLAKQTARDIMNRLWSEREKFSFSLPFSYHNIKPGDVIKIINKPSYFDKNINLDLLITACDVGINGVIKFEACRKNRI